MIAAGHHASGGIWFHVDAGVVGIAGKGTHRGGPAMR